MNNIVKDIKLQVKKTLSDALKELEDKEDLSGVDDALQDTKNMCNGINKMYDDSTVATTLDATEGEWARIVNRL